MPKQSVAKTTPALTDDQLAALRTLMPQIFTEGRIDPEKLRATLGDLADPSTGSGQALPERYSFSWAGKRDAIRLLQAPSRATLVPCPEESLTVDGTACHPEERSDEGSPRNKETLRAFGAQSDRQSQNLFIEGDNLEVLKLLYKPYFGRVKMIYIDPPYNTGNDFVYPDNFADPLDTYLKLTGQKDSAGNLLTSNPETGGRYHSAWLSMMYPRLFLARQLLREDGVIFVSIDDNEIHDLRLVMNEIFGEEYFVAQLVWQKKTGAGARSKGYIVLHEYILCYAKQIDPSWDLTAPMSEKTKAMYNKQDEYYEKLGHYATWPLDTTSMDDRANLRFPIRHNGQEIWPKKQWLWSRDRVEKAQKENKLVFNYNENDKTWNVRFKGYLYGEDGIERKGKPTSLILGSYTQEGSKDFEEFFNKDVFPFPKPVSVIQQLLSVQIKGEIKNDDIFLDFFAGFCTTAQAVLELNREDGGGRRFIMVQLPEPTGNKQFPTIAEIGKERIRRVVARMKKEREGQLALDKPEDLGFKVFKLAPSHYRQWEVAAIHELPQHESPESYARQAELFADPLVEGWQPENVLYEVALKEGYGLNIEVASIHELTPHTWRVTDPDKGQSFYFTLAGKIALKDLRPLDLKKDDLFICRDEALNDEAAANLALQCRLKTI